MEAIRLHQTIEKNGEVTITNLPVVKGQQVEVVLLFSEPDTKDAERPARARLTARELLNSGLIGLWKERDDIGDSVDYARQLRGQARL